jgi:NosR/NirI family transcriptional regulator, nitrous oxide reductase regulator
MPCPFHWLRAVLLSCLFSMGSAALAEPLHDDIRVLFPKATRIDTRLESPPVHPVYQLDELLGYAFESNHYSALQGFSGKPIRLLIGLDPEGTLSGVRVLEHHEPVFLHGLGESALQRFIDQYRNVSITRPIVVGGSRSGGDGGSVHQFDGVSKATVSVVILNETVMISAMEVARKLLDGFAQGPLAIARDDLFEPLTLEQMLARGYLQHWRIDNEEVEAGLGHSLARLTGLDEGGPFSELWFAYLNAPSIGRNLLGQENFERLRGELRENEQALLVLSRGRYRHVPDDFTPATAPATLVLVQNGHPIELHDMNLPGDMIPLLGLEREEMSANIFRIKPHAGFNPVADTLLQLNVSLQRNHLVRSEASLTTALSLDPELFEILEPPPPSKPVPVWLRMWQERWWQVVILVLALGLLSWIFLDQQRFSRNSRGFHRLRAGFLLFTLLFIGLYAQGQLSVVNVLALLLALWEGFDITIFLMDPVIFILWSFTFVSLFLWGRGLFCGWLCPFGALQEMIGWVAKRLHIRQWKVSDPWHRRMQWVKYLILIALVPLAFYSLTLAERLAEVEPFKTSITLFFVRSWPFVLYALVLLGLGLFIHKFYCRYLCPLGAGLAILGRLRLFSWLRRIDACGKPCQHCHNHCEIDAIRRDGSIDYDECIQCLECIVILNNEDQCVASISARKKAQKQRQRQPGTIIATDWVPSR